MLPPHVSHVFCIVGVNRSRPVDVCKSGTCLSHIKHGHKARAHAYTLLARHRYGLVNLVQWLGEDTKNKFVF